MSTIRDLTVLSTDLARTDRRALSQAWYDALHVAHAPSRTLKTKGRPQNAEPSPPRPSAAVAHIERQGARFDGGRAVRASNAPPHERGFLERRRVPSREVQRLGGVVARRAAIAAEQATFAVRIGEGRAHIHVRRHGGRLHILAVCTPALRARVDAALAHARFALAARGMTVEASR